MKTLLFMAFLICGVTAALFLGGCAGTFDTPRTPEYDWGPNTPKHYTYVDSREELEALCGKAGEGKIRLGCLKKFPATPKESCEIVLYSRGSEDIKEHEEDHCRYGRWHP